jgi:flagellar protein FliO/FliZ
MTTIITWGLLLAVLGGALFFGAIAVRAYMNGTSPSEILFRQKPEPRIQVIEHAAMDSRRRLVLIRRDDVEHLIMTGGPVDVVIETGIGEQKMPQRVAEPVAPQATVFSRAPRAFGQAVPKEEAS